MRPFPALQHHLLCALLFALLFAICWAVGAGSSASCRLPDAVARVGGELSLTYIRLAVGCDRTSNSDNDEALSASLLPARPPSQFWPPSAAALAENARFALTVLDGLLTSTSGHGGRRRLRRLSLGGLPLGNVTPLVPALLRFDGLTQLNLTAIGSGLLPAELLHLPRLRRLHAGENPLDCRLPENRWAVLLSRLGSTLLAPAPLLACPGVNLTAGVADHEDSGNATDGRQPVFVIDREPAVLQVQLGGDLRLPCSSRYFRSADAGLWSSSSSSSFSPPPPPDSGVVWRRAEPEPPSGAGPSSCLSLNGSSGVVYRTSPLRFVSRLSMGDPADGAPLLASGLRRAVTGLWRCELARAGVWVAARHRLVLLPPLAGVEVACYVVAAASAVGMVLLGLTVGFLRAMVRSRCCTRVVHIVEAQSVHNLDASPQQLRRQRRQAAAGAYSNDDGEDHRWDSGDAAGATSAAATALISVPEVAGPSSGAAAAGWRDRLRDINDQMRLQMASFGESVGSTMRAGWSSGMEHMKEQMRSVAEFCGTNTPLGQTVSVVSVYTDPEGRQEPLERHLHLLSSV